MAGAIDYYNADQTDASGFSIFNPYGKVVPQIDDLIGDADGNIQSEHKTFFKETGGDNAFKFIQYTEGYHKSSEAHFTLNLTGNNFTVFAVLKIPAIQTGGWHFLAFSPNGSLGFFCSRLGRAVGESYGLRFQRR